MQYTLLIYTDETIGAGAPPEAQKQMMDEYWAYEAWLADRGMKRAGEALHNIEPGHQRAGARRRRVDDRRTVRRDQGTARRLLPARSRQPRRRHRGGAAVPGQQVRVTIEVRPVMDFSRWRARSSARTPLLGGRRPPVPSRVRTGGRGPDPSGRKLRPRRGRRAGRVRSRARAMASRRLPRQPRRVDHDHGAEPGDRPHPTRSGRSDEGGDRRAAPGTRGASVTTRCTRSPTSGCA